MSKSLDRLARLVEEAREPIRNIGFSDVIPILYGCTVQPLVDLADVEELKASLDAAMNALMEELDGKPLSKDRPNEAGNGIEAHEDVY